MEKKFAEMERRMVALEEESLIQNCCLSVFDQLQEEYWVNQVAMEERADKAYTAQSTLKEKTTAELELLNVKGMWMNNLLHEDCRKLHLQEKRVDGLVTFVEMLTCVWCKNKVESWKEYSNELGNGMDMLCMCMWECEQ